MEAPWARALVTDPRPRVRRRLPNPRRVAVLMAAILGACNYWALAPVHNPVGMLLYLSKIVALATGLGIVLLAAVGMVALGNRVERGRNATAGSSDDMGQRS